MSSDREQADQAVRLEFELEQIDRGHSPDSLQVERSEQERERQQLLLADHQERWPCWPAEEQQQQRLAAQR
jgi:hypothetical protein